MLRVRYVFSDFFSLVVNMIAMKFPRNKMKSKSSQFCEVTLH